MNQNIPQYYNELIHQTLDDLEKAKGRKKQRRHYQKYKAEYVKLRLNPEEREYWVRLAKKEKSSLSGLIKSSAKAYRKKKYRVPGCLQKRLDRSIFLLEKCASNVNQLTRYTHQSNGHIRVNELKHEILAMRNIMSELLDNPPDDDSKING